MTYKGMILSVLLVPCTLIGNRADTRIQQLNNDLQAKEVELFQLARMIEEKQQWIDSTFQAQKDFLSMHFGISNKEEYEQFKKEIHPFGEELDNVGWAAEDLQKFLATRFDNVTKNFDEVLERTKAMMIRYSIEYHLLFKLVKRYEQCAQEFLALEIALKNV